MHICQIYTNTGVAAAVATSMGFGFAWYRNPIIRHIQEKESQCNSDPLSAQNLAIQTAIQAGALFYLLDRINVASTKERVLFSAGIGVSFACSSHYAHFIWHVSGTKSIKAIFIDCGYMVLKSALQGFILSKFVKK